MVTDKKESRVQIIHVIVTSLPGGGGGVILHIGVINVQDHHPSEGLPRQQVYKRDILMVLGNLSRVGTILHNV